MAAAEGQLGAALAQVAATSQQLESLQGVADQLRKECTAAKAEVSQHLGPVHAVKHMTWLLWSLLQLPGSC